MQLALTQTQQLVTPQQAPANERLTCPHCGQAVRLVRGQRRSYFRHLMPPTPRAGESSVHLAGKDQLFLKFKRTDRQIETEVNLPEFKRRIDVLVHTKEQRLALEYQCSPISAWQLAQRTQAYQQAKLQVRWIFGPRYTHPSRYQQQLMTQWISKQPCLVTMAPPTWIIHYRFITPPPKSGWERMKREYHALHRLRQAKPSALATLAYQQGHRIWLCPVGLHTLVESWPVTKEPLLFWQIRLLLLLEQVPPQTTWTQISWQAWVTQRTQWAKLPLLTYAQQKQLQQIVLQQLLKHWIANGYLIYQGGIIKLGTINWEQSDQSKWQHLGQVSRQQRPLIAPNRLVGPEFENQ